MESALQKNKSFALANIEKLKKLEDKLPISIYETKQDLKNGIRYWRNVLAR